LYHSVRQAPARRDRFLTLGTLGAVRSRGKLEEETSAMLDIPCYNARLACGSKRFIAWFSHYFYNDYSQSGIHQRLAKIACSEAGGAVEQLPGKLSGTVYKTD
jgi:hypothetical protein